MAEIFNEKTWIPLVILDVHIIRSLLLGVKRSQELLQCNFDKFFFIFKKIRKKYKINPKNLKKKSSSNLIFRFIDS